MLQIFNEEIAIIATYVCTNPISVDILGSQVVCTHCAIHAIHFTRRKDYLTKGCKMLCVVYKKNPVHSTSGIDLAIKR